MRALPTRSSSMGLVALQRVGVFSVAHFALRCCYTSSSNVPSRDNRAARAAPSPPVQQNPMEVLSRVFQEHPPALRLHRELTIRLAAGDADAAADLAATLAESVVRVQANWGKKDGKDDPTREPTSRGDANLGEEPPLTATLDVIANATTATQRALLDRATSQEFLDAVHCPVSPTDAASGQEFATGDESERPFWRSTNALSVTLLESAFEADGEVGNALTTAGSTLLDQEQQHVAVLAEYLNRDEQRWQAQKNAVAKILLDVARELGLTPEDLHASEETTVRPTLNPLQHSNLVVRAEVPTMALAANETTEARIDEELSLLRKRMESQGTPMSPTEETMARYELQMVNTTMRYIVGIHRDLQTALDQSPAVLQAMRATGCDERVRGSGFFVQRAMEELHRTPDQVTSASKAKGNLSVERVVIAENLMTPVVPYTYMLKCCLWFDVTTSA